jgi:glycosyltransferase involved in cell wall biosynthesis
MAKPRVTFVVPCYKLAHLLPECVASILAQSYQDFEVLIMDDCSPDDTAAVARSFTDTRVRHVRNDPNLGHLRNYNKGLSLAAGDYIWLISADDVLRKPYVLERYVSLLDAHPEVGFAFCPGFGLRDQRETDIVKWGQLDSPDTVFEGRTFLKRLLQSNCVLAPSVLARKECYDRFGDYPLDLPYAGDWYMWCVFALHYDVAYFAEPMVNYREHGESMTDILIAQNIERLSEDDLSVRWRMHQLITETGDQPLARHCRQEIITYYQHALASKTWRGAKFRLGLEQFERSLARNVVDPDLRAQLRHEVLGGVGRHLYWHPELETDLRLYKLALEHGRRDPRLFVKYSVLRLGPVGLMLMRALSSMRDRGRTRNASAS